MSQPEFEEIDQDRSQRDSVSDKFPVASSVPKEYFPQQNAPSIAYMPNGGEDPVSGGPLGGTGGT
jgi:hypothetical protein